jgi:N6-L-threonylcarbamoyladenine synthase
LIEQPGRYQLIGRTRDDAAGEAYDKVAKLLGLGYPGGPAIDRVARGGNDRAFDFPATRLTHADRNAPKPTAAGILPAEIARRVDFSFSKAAASDDAGAALPASEVADIAASFQRAVVEALLDRTFEAARWLDVKSIGIAGGVSANSRLRADADARGAHHGIPVFIPPLALSTDNAAKIGAAGLRRFRSVGAGTFEFNAEASLGLV